MQIITESEREKVATFGVETRFAAQGKWHNLPREEKRKEREFLEVRQV